MRTEEHFYGPDEPIDVDPTEALRTAMNVIHQQPDTGLLPVELSVIDGVCDEVEAWALAYRGQRVTKVWHRAAVATKAILRDHSEDVKAEWIAAYAGLPPME